MDTTRRNNLLYFRDLKTGTLDLRAAQNIDVTKVFAGEKVPLRRLVPNEVDDRAGIKLREIVRKAQSNLEEKGLQTLFVAYGMATWPVEDGGRAPEAAVLLLPITVDGRRTDPDSLTLQGAGVPQANIALLHSLAEEHGVSITEEDLLNAAYVGERFDPDLAVQKVVEETRQLLGFEVRRRVVVGNFSFQKLAMVKDIKERSDQLAAHDMIAALAGDTEARSSLGGRHVSLEPHQLDALPAACEFMVLDADSSQQIVIHSVASDLDGVILGPPGCGKSQTIANVIATLVALGKRVLFVAEKRAALEAVYKRLSSRGLGHLALDLHGAAVSQKTVMEKVGVTLQRIRHASEPQDQHLHEKFEDRRGRLIAHVRALHSPQQPSGLSPFQMQAGMLEAARLAVSRTRWRGSDLQRITALAYANVLDLLGEAVAVAPLFTRIDTSPWTNAQLSDGYEVQAAIDAAHGLSEEHLPKLRTALESLSNDTGLSVRTVEEARTSAILTDEVNSFLAEWQPSVFDACPPVASLQAVARGQLAVFWALLTNPGFRAARRQMASLSKTGARGPTALYEGCRRAHSLAERWRDASARPSKPHSVELACDVQDLLCRAAGYLSDLKRALPQVSSLGIEDLHTLTISLAEDEVTAHSIPGVRVIEDSIAAHGAGAIIDELRSSSVPPRHWGALFTYAYLASCYDLARSLLPQLASFRGETHSNFAHEFRCLDEERLLVASARVSREHAERAIAAMNAEPEQALLLKAEVAKRSRHLPLRRLVSQAADVLTAVCPCWMSSPLNVSQLLPSERQCFDVVIFDEASQVLPEDAVCSIMRGQRLVVAGDRHQLPPTIFFADGADAEDDGAPTSGYESLLDQLSAFVDHWPLDWHYRSQDERLIAFSNKHIYGNRLTTFPGVGGLACVSHVLVDSLPRDGEEESCTAEVERVVSLIMEHATHQIRRQPGDWQSLGVIAMGIKHANRIQAKLDTVLESRRDLEAFFDLSRDEHFFVKNLERVQGDERDAIILTVGYSKDHNGRLPYRFGPLLMQGGERRLNVAISRAKQKVTVVSSFSHADMDPRRSERKGVELLRLYLQFAVSAGLNLGDVGGTGEAMNAFEADVHDALVGCGIPLVPQYGVSGYRLDFVAMHPTREGEFVLAIECDGASYHSAPTARDRDRLRQQQLERIGWRFHRIWSTDWFLRREEQIQAVVKAWKDSVDASDERHLVRTACGPGRLSAVTNPPEDSEQLPNARAKAVRGPKPDVPVLGDIELYTRAELIQLVKWIRSDGLLRTDGEIVTEVVQLLGLRRRGAKIVRAVTSAIEALS